MNKVKYRVLAILIYGLGLAMGFDCRANDGGMPIVQSQLRTADFIYSYLELQHIENEGEIVEFMQLYNQYLRSKPSPDRNLLYFQLRRLSGELFSLLKILGFPQLRHSIKVANLENSIRLLGEEAWKINGSGEREACNAACSREFIGEVKDNVSRSIEKGDVVGAIVEIVDPRGPIDNARACYAKCASQ